jgi:hypothetical protein
MGKVVHEMYTKVVPELSGYGFVAIPLDDKRPILKNWNKLDKTPSRLYVFQNRNIGILTGRVSGITVLDIDIKNDGLELWTRLSSSYPEIKTPVVQSPSGGLHIYFRYNKKLHSFSRFTLRGKTIGWDLLNNDRQAVVPPSKNMTTGKEYKWLVSPEQCDFASMPQWLEDYLMKCKFFDH